MWYNAILARAFDLGDCKIMSSDPGDSNSVKILNRSAKLDATGLKFEADPRHIASQVRSLNISQGRPVFTTGFKEKAEDDV